VSTRTESVKSKEEKVIAHSKLRKSVEEENNNVRLT